MNTLQRKGIIIVLWNINIPGDDEAECLLPVDGRVPDNLGKPVLAAARDMPQSIIVDIQLQVKHAAQESINQPSMALLAGGTSPNIVFVTLEWEPTRKQTYVLKLVSCTYTTWCRQIYVLTLNILACTYTCTGVYYYIMLLYVYLD